MQLILAIIGVIAIGYYFLNPNVINTNEIKKTTEATTGAIQDIRDNQNSKSIYKNDYINIKTNDDFYR